MDENVFFNLFLNEFCSHQLRHLVQNQSPLILKTLQQIDTKIKLLSEKHLTRNGKKACRGLAEVLSSNKGQCAPSEFQNLV
jgi:hypothetical protein